MNGIYYPKQSDIFIKKLEKHFDVKSSDFLWIDDSQQIVDNVAAFGSRYILVSDKNRLKDVLESLL